MEPRISEVGTGYDPLTVERTTRRWIEIERVVAGVLRRMKDDGLISEFARRADTPDMRPGADFTVFAAAPYDDTTRSFGVTTSATARNVRAGQYRDVRALHFPLETKPETIRARILTLFERQHGD